MVRDASLQELDIVGHGTFGVVVNDEQMGQRVLHSVQTIVDFIESNRLPAGGG